jgi:hypothetical protein
MAARRLTGTLSWLRPTTTASGDRRRQGAMARAAIGGRSGCRKFLIAFLSWVVVAAVNRGVCESWQADLENDLDGDLKSAQTFCLGLVAVTDRLGPDLLPRAGR